MPAQDQALEVPEILEAVLLRLPPRDLLVSAQRVSKSWNQAIRASRSIQRALFFEHRKEEQSNPVFNPLLQRAFPVWFAGRTGQRDTSRGGAFKHLDWNVSLRKRAAYARNEASWRRMLTVQPPPKTLVVMYTSVGQMGTTDSEGEVQFPAGVRMGTLYDYAFIQAADPITTFWVEYDTLWEPELVKGKRTSIVRMHIHHVTRCYIDERSDVSFEFRSEGWEPLDVVLDLKKRVFHDLDEDL